MSRKAAFRRKGTCGGLIRKMQVTETVGRNNFPKEEELLYGSRKNESYM